MNTCNRNSATEYCCMTVKECLVSNIDEYLLSNTTEPKYMKLLPLPVNDASDGRSIQLLSSINSTLHYHRIVVVVGILINRLSTVVTNKRQIVHFDGLKLWEIYVSRNSIIPTNHLE